MHERRSVEVILAFVAFLGWLAFNKRKPPGGTRSAAR